MRVQVQSARWFHWLVYRTSCSYASDLDLQPLYQNAVVAAVVFPPALLYVCRVCRHRIVPQPCQRALHVALFNDGKYLKRTLGKWMHHFHLLSAQHLRRTFLVQIPQVCLPQMLMCRVTQCYHLLIISVCHRLCRCF